MRQTTNKNYVTVDSTAVEHALGLVFNLRFVQSCLLRLILFAMQVNFGQYPELFGVERCVD